MNDIYQHSKSNRWQQTVSTNHLELLQIPHPDQDVNVCQKSHINGIKKNPYILCV